MMHGTDSCYVNRRCRCGPCRTAHTEYALRSQASRASQDKRDDDPRHGTLSFYVNHKCRCQRCKEANAQYARRQRSQEAAS